jgi:hypothetical protein
LVTWHWVLPFLQMRAPVKVAEPQLLPDWVDGPVQAPTGLARPSSMTPLQSLSTLSQVSVVGKTDCTQMAWPPASQA